VGIFNALALEPGGVARSVKFKILRTPFSATPVFCKRRQKKLARAPPLMQNCSSARTGFTDILNDVLDKNGVREII
jgi:hypothetical protein